MAKYYISTCVDTGRVFVCEAGTDNNVCEVFARSKKESAAAQARKLVQRYNDHDDLVMALQEIDRVCTAKGITAQDMNDALALTRTVLRRTLRRRVAE